MREMAESSQSGGESVEQIGMARQVTEATLADVATPSGRADRLAAWAARHPRGGQSAPSAVGTERAGEIHSPPSRQYS